jgi:outer membrane protein OmpA-like peptidoglycan-associated protein
MRKPPSVLIAAAGIMAASPQLARAQSVPLVSGLTMVSAIHLAEGDREDVIAVQSVTPDGVTYVWRRRLRQGNARPVEDTLQRFVSAADLAGAPRLNNRFQQGGGPDEEPGYTAMTLSRASYSGLLAKHEIRYTVVSTPREERGQSLKGMFTTTVTLKGTLSLASPKAEPVPVLLNGRRTTLPAMHLKGQFAFQDDHRDVDYWVLADSMHPVVLKVVAAAGVWQMIRIEVPESGASSGRAVEQQLERECRAELPGIYFAFGSAELQPASDLAIAGIATLVARHADWSLQVEGHTDSIGNPAANQQLSLDRAEAVRAALIARHAIAPARLRSAGFGATRPREPNATIEGRARNRRVELVRNCAGAPR